MWAELTSSASSPRRLSASAAAWRRVEIMPAQLCEVLSVHDPYMSDEHACYLKMFRDCFTRTTDSKCHVQLWPAAMAQEAHLVANRLEVCASTHSSCILHNTGQNLQQMSLSCMFARHVVQAVSGEGYLWLGHQKGCFCGPCPPC